MDQPERDCNAQFEFINAKAGEALSAAQTLPAVGSVSVPAAVTTVVKTL